MNRLAVLPSDRIDDLIEAGYENLRSYYNPGEFFSEVIVLSPLEKKTQIIQGMRIQPVTPLNFGNFCRQNRITCVRAYGGVWNADFAVAFTPPDIPVIVSLHDDRTSWIHPSTRYADQVIAVSLAVQRIAATRGIRAEIIPNRIDDNIFNHSPTENPYESRPGIPVLSVGRISYEKNQELLIDSIAFLPKPFYAVIVGQGDKRQCVERALKRGAADRVIFIDSISQTKLKSWYQHSGIFCLMSRHEGFGKAILEAMASGALVVSSNIPPINEFIQNNVNGVLIPPNSPPQHLAKVLSSTFESPLKKSMQEKAVLASKNFYKSKWDEIESQMYEQLISRARIRSIPVVIYLHALRSLARELLRRKAHIVKNKWMIR